MFAKIQERINKLLWVKQSAEGLFAQGKDLMANAKAAVEDIRKDGIGMDDLAKVSNHFESLKEKASDIVADAKWAVAQAKGDKVEQTKDESEIASEKTNNDEVA